MKTVKMINRVPLSDGKGGSYLPMEGDECIVTNDEADALVKGGDAEIVEMKAEPVVPAAAPVAETAKADKQKTQNKNKGAAPENK